MLRVSRQHLHFSHVLLQNKVCNLCMIQYNTFMLMVYSFECWFVLSVLSSKYPFFKEIMNMEQ